MKSQKIAFGLLCAIILGCGGSAGINSGFPDAPSGNNLVPAGPGVDGGATLRTFLPGDTWEYELGGTMLREDYDDQEKLKSKTSGPVTGTLIRQVSSVTFQGVPTLKFTDTLSYKINGGQNKVEILETYGRQEPDGSVTMLGRRDNNTDCGVVTKPWLPGTFAAGTSVGGQAKFTGLAVPDDFYETSTALASTNSRSVASSTAAPFTTWRSFYSDAYVHDWDIYEHFPIEFVGKGYKIKTVEEIFSTDDWNPLWGAPVQRAYQTTRTDSIVDSLTFENGTWVLEYHLEKRSLDLKMVLKSHALQ